jgi:hypothetical protein
VQLFHVPVGSCSIFFARFRFHAPFNHCLSSKGGYTSIYYLKKLQRFGSKKLKFKV